MAGESPVMIDAASRCRAVLQRARQWFDRGLGLLYPPACAACGVELESDSHEVLLCTTCRTLLAPQHGPLCPRCGALLVSRRNLIRGGCPRCFKRKLSFESVVSLGVYEGPLRRTVLRMKKPTGESLSITIGHLLYQIHGQQMARRAPDVVVPIPMHWRRRIVRGTNCPEVLAEILGRQLRVPIARRLLFRRRKTLPQFTLPPSNRFRNISGAFGVAAGFHLDTARILLVDDIMTTGATCSEATKALHAAGAGSVDVAVVARAEGL